MRNPKGEPYQHPKSAYNVMILTPESGCAVVKSQGHLGNAGLIFSFPPHGYYTENDGAQRMTLHMPKWSPPIVGKAGESAADGIFRRDSRPDALA